MKQYLHGKYGNTNKIYCMAKQTFCSWETCKYTFWMWSTEKHSTTTEYTESIAIVIASYPIYCKYQIFYKAKCIIVALSTNTLVLNLCVIYQMWGDKDYHKTHVLNSLNFY